jgi:para-aminobenzoate synthetase component I
MNADANQSNPDQWRSHEVPYASAAPRIVLRGAGSPEPWPTLVGRAIGTLLVELIDGRPRSRWIGPATGVRLSHDPLGDLDSTLAVPPTGIAGWAIAVSYDLGRVIEPRAGISPTGAARSASGRSSAAEVLLELHAVHAGAVATAMPLAVGTIVPRSLTGEPGFRRDVARVVESIRAGEIFQANLAHALDADVPGRVDPAVLFEALAAVATPRYGCMIELAGGQRGSAAAIVSASPELFLHVDAASRRIVTRPMKGTRPIAGDSAELERSAKDRAELNMIIDLMRNDLGRVCRFGSVRVDEPRTIERHGGAAGVLQATGTVSGTLRAGVSLGQLLAATFPPGSVTGAPKIQAMRVIDTLEPCRRGFYCGALGWIALDGSITLSVAIRTALVEWIGAAGHTRLRYPVGAGIVADSDPQREWEETLVKAAAFRRVLGTHDAR